jgi:hypothetical protein
MHWPPQSLVPALHSQMPLTQVRLGGHGLLQPPQCASSQYVERHELLQHAIPAGQQKPLQQSRPLGQQGLVHGGVGQQFRLPEGHWYVPLTHFRPVFVQSFPQSAQLVSVPSLVGVHCGRQHFSPGCSARPHAPQWVSVQMLVQVPSQHNSLKASHGVASHELQNNSSVFRSAQ